MSSVGPGNSFINASMFMIGPVRPTRPVNVAVLCIQYRCFRSDLCSKAK